MALQDIDAVDDGARPYGTRATADMTQAAAVVEIDNLFGVTCTRDDADGALRSASSRLAMLALDAYRRELLSDGALPRLLPLGRVELRKIQDAVGMDRTTDLKYQSHEAEDAGRAEVSCPPCSDQPHE